MNYTTMHSPSNNKPMLQGAKPPANNVINNQLQQPIIASASTYFVKSTENSNYNKINNNALTKQIVQENLLDTNQIRTTTINKNMASRPFQASEAFDKNMNNDGWDDWDWNDNSNPYAQQQSQQSIPQQHQSPQQQQQQQHQSQPSPATYYQQQQHSNLQFNPNMPVQNFRPSQNNNVNPNFTSFSSPQNQFQHYNSSVSPNPTNLFGSMPLPPQQQHQQGQQNQQQQSPMMHMYSGANPTNNVQAITSNPSYQPVNEESVFNNNNNNNVNVNYRDLTESDTSNFVNNNIPISQPSQDNLNASINFFDKLEQPTMQQQLINTQNSFQMQSNRNDDVNAREELETTSRIPDNSVNTPFNKQLPQVMKLYKNDKLSPQWSIESQISQTSSDKSIESDSKSSTHYTPQSHSFVENSEIIPNRIPYNADKHEKISSTSNYFEQKTNVTDESNSGNGEMMKLTTPTTNTNAEFTHNIETQSGGITENTFLPLPPPPLAECTETVNLSEQSLFEHTSNVQRTKSNTTPPLPPPPIESNAMKISSQVEPNSGMKIQQVPIPPIDTSSGPKMNPPTAMSAAVNPYSVDKNRANNYRRVGRPVHQSLSAQSSDLSSSQQLQQPPPPQQHQQQQAIPSVSQASMQFYQQKTKDVHSMEQPDNSEYPDVNRDVEVENVEVAPNNDRNKYLQTSHLSEEGYNTVKRELTTEINDNPPPPGLSRLVLGQPENDNINRNFVYEPPEGLDRMIPGTDLSYSNNFNLNRQADGQVSSLQPINQTVQIPPMANINTTDRNLYLVPGESDIQSQRVVLPGVDNVKTSAFQAPPAPLALNVESMMSDFTVNDQHREVIMDGENLDDNDKLNEIASRNEPIEGANNSDANIQLNSSSADINTTIDTNKKDFSLASSCEDSDRDRMLYKTGQNMDDKKRKFKNKERYETEDTDYSDRDRRIYKDEKIREKDSHGKLEKEQRDSKEKERSGLKSRDRREPKDKDKYRESKYDRYRERDRDRDQDRDRDARYETDGSRYETESSRKYDKDDKRYSTRDEYWRRNDDDYRRDDKDRRYKRERDDRNPHRDRDRDREDKRRVDDRYRDDREFRDKTRRDRPERERRYDDESFYRTRSRNAERDKTNRNREVLDKERKYQNYYPQGYGYDAYSYYIQHQQYYENLRRTNPQAYADWYRQFYGQMQERMQRDADGRESVHSGRSSANDKERYNRSIHQYYNNDYHRQFNLSQPSVATASSLIMDASYSCDTTQLTANQQQRQQQQQSFSQPGHYLATHVGFNSGLSGGPTSMERSYYNDNNYHQLRNEIDPASSLNLDKMSTSSKIEPQRYTPSKYPTVHCTASLTNGILVSVKPRFAANGQTGIVRISNMGYNDATRKLLLSYPGPLVRGITHKKSVIEFCEEQIRNGPTTLVKSRGNSVSSLYSTTQANRGSFVLLWNYLILLLRQNGICVGTDISELLIKNKEEYPFEAQSQLNNFKSSCSSDRQSVMSDNMREGRESEVGDVINADIVEDNSIDNEEKEKQSSDLSEKEVTDIFRNYLLYGNISEALKWATDNNLWGHALFLASKVDRRQHADVMTKFANKLTLTDPLQTVYQLMSGRMPSSVNSILDEKWGDWRPHLGMIVSNIMDTPELNKKSIMTLGDSLYNRGDLYGAQFCYLLAEVNFSKYSNVNQESKLISNSVNAIRLVLIGSSQHKPFREFATNEAIMMTEIYEFVRSLSDETNAIVDLQPYKFLLATRMLDSGMQLKCFTYIEEIGKQILLSPSKYDYQFIEKIFTLGDRLKFYDPTCEKSSFSLNSDAAMEDPIWLTDLAKILNDFETNGFYASEQQNLNQTENNFGNYSNMSSSTPLTNMYAQDSHTDSLQNEYKSQIDQQFVEINQQLGQLNLQYGVNDKDKQQLPIQTQPQPPQMYGNYGIGNQQTMSGTENLVENQGPLVDQYNNTYNPQQYYNPIQEDASKFNNPINYDDMTDYNASANFDNNNADATMTQQQLGYDYGNQRPGENEPFQKDTNNKFRNFDHIDDDNYDDEEDEHDNEPLHDHLQNNDDKTDMPKPTISMPNSVSNKNNFYDDSHPNANDGKRTANETGERTGDDSRNPATGKSNEGNKNANKTNNNPGWFGGILGVFSLKPKNQMILPDDKNPTIVWDPDKKKWVNKDGETEQSEAFKPPPKLMQAAQPLQANIPQMGMQPFAATPPIENTAVPETVPISGVPASTTPAIQTNNMFKMQKNRNLKKSYVDIFNPNGTAQPPRPIESSLLPTSVPASSIPQSGYFVPGENNQPIDGQEGVPQFYNPNQYGGYQQ